jgi:uncharacterized protein
MDNATAFIDAIEAGDLDQVQALLDAQPELLELRVDDWMSPVLLAMYYNQPEIAQRLWKRGAVLDIFGAAAVGDGTRLEELLQVYPDLALAYARLFRPTPGSSFPDLARRAGKFGLQ